MSFSVNILHDINVCLVAPVYMDYLVFLQRLKHDSPWLVKLSLSVQRRHLQAGHLCPRKEEAVGLRKKPALDEVRVRLVLEVVDEGS
jgi:hypothetical protein